MLKTLRLPSFLPIVSMLLLLRGVSLADTTTTKSVLIVVEGSSDLKNRAMGDGRQLAALMGHFNTSVRLQGVDEYVPHSMDAYDVVFYIGFHAKDQVPQKFLSDVMSGNQPVVWLNTGFREFSSAPGVRKKYGFFVARLDTSSVFDVVRSRGQVFSKGEPNLNIIDITHRNQVTVLATSSSSKTGREVPYIVKSGNLLYVGDSPFASATETDRYLLFSDMLHDILHEDHEESHSALIRIEDVTPLENPDRLRDIADILSARGIPFLVSVIPFYVSPGEGLKVSLSDKPDLVDALHYMVQNGGTIVMHGVTHQYKGVTASDFEFWDENTNRPVKNETAESISRRLDMGIQEFMKNSLYPLAWETPHYTAPFLVYRTVAAYFSTAIEQRLAIEDYDYSQYFPYLIKKDLFGQVIYPENLGYVPLDPDRDRSEGYIHTMIQEAKANLAVRDGFASCFFHAFVELDLLKELVDGIQGLGYTYIDLREHTNWVNTRDRVILSGSQEYTIHLDGQYLAEAYFDRNGEMFDRSISDARILGTVNRKITLEPGQFYKAEPMEYRERPVSLAEQVTQGAEHLYRAIFPEQESWKEARVVILWNHHARGAAYNDQASLASVFACVNLPVDTIFTGDPMNLSPYNLVIVPYAFVDSLRQSDYDALTHFAEEGGNLITDGKNDLAEELGFKFSDAKTKVLKVQDRYFPQEPISWRYPELATKFDADNIDETFCVSEESETPLVVGKRYGHGRVIFFGTRFDPYSQHGYSFYPYLMEYVRRYFRVGPLIRREELEVYFEPGLRHTVSIEHLIAQWVKQGIRIVHVSGWHEYPKYTYDYKRLITLAHANGILVYAWLEPPQVSQKFWLEHPEWREKNYRGDDVQPSWRYPVTLTDDRCVQAMAEKFTDFLRQYDWDGVDLAELYFDGAKGFKDPRTFTPMHPSAQKEVRRQYGIELTKIFDPSSPFYWKDNPGVMSAIEQYRVKSLSEVYRVLLDRFAGIARAREGFQVIVTGLDSYGSPELREYNGVDMDSIIALQKTYGFLLQVEDPESMWSGDPARYVAIGNRYKERVGDSSKVMLDLNILTFRKPDAVTPFPTLIQTGTESFHLLNDATLGARRMTIYSESTVNPQDMLFFPYASSVGVEYNHTAGGYSVNAPWSFVLKPPRETGEIQLDGAPLSPVRDNLYVIPAGEHTIGVNQEPAGSFSTHTLQGRIMSLTGNLLSVSYGMRSVSFDYVSDTRTLVSLSAQPTSVIVDGKGGDYTVMKGDDCYTVQLPAGRHHVDLVTGDTFSYGVNLTSLWSTTAIVLFGSLAVMSLAIMYIVGRVVRLRAIRP